MKGEVDMSPDDATHLSCDQAGFEAAMQHAAAHLLVSSHGKVGEDAEKMRSLAAMLQMLSMEDGTVNEMAAGSAVPHDGKAGIAGECRAPARGATRARRKKLRTRREIARSREYDRPGICLSG